MFSVADTSVTPASPRREVDRHVVGSVAGKPVDLMDDAVVRPGARDVLDHPHQLGPVGLAGGLARVDELLDDRRAELVGLPAGSPRAARSRASARSRPSPAAPFVETLGGTAAVIRGHRVGATRLSIAVRSASIIVAWLFSASHWFRRPRGRCDGGC